MSAKKLIGVFATEISSRVQGNLYKELHRKARELGYKLVFFSGTYDKVNLSLTTAVTRNLYELAENNDFSAFIIHAQSIGSRELIGYLIDLGKKKNIPVFVYDCESLGIDKSPNVFPINLNYKQGFAESVKHVIEHHHCKNIFMLAGMRDNKFSDDRIEMYKQEMTSHGLDFCEEMIGYGDFWERPAMAAVNKFLDSGLPTPEAICCANDAMAITTIKVLKTRGLRVPEDGLVTGFDGIEDGKYNYPSISTCEPMLDTAADYIFGVIEKKEDAAEFLIPLRFYPKDSCGCTDERGIEARKEMTNLVEKLNVNSWHHHMLTTMQFELIDSSDIKDIVAFMNGTLDFINNYYHVFCLRDDIENQTDCRADFDKMCVFMNKGFLPESEYETYPAYEIVPDFTKAIVEDDKNDIFYIRLIHSGDKKYGYHIIKTTDYSSIDLKIIGQFMESVTIVIESILRNMRLKQANQKLSEMYERMSEIYIRDTMTGLYNRHGYYNDLEEYIKREDLKDSFIHIISIDMDGMKAINDNFGHLEGDNAIKSVAKAIKDCFAQPCIAARFGGDEFVVALFTEKEEPSTEKMTTKLNSYLEKLPSLADKQYKVEVSVGQAVAKLSQMDDLKTIEKLADDYMYEEKRKRKSKN